MRVCNLASNLRLLGDARQVYEFGPFRLDVAERRLLRDGSPVAVTAKVFEILTVLVRQCGRLVTKEELMRAVWHNSEVEGHNLTVSMSALRKALGETHGRPEYVETVPRAGYRFIAPVRSVLPSDVGEVNSLPAGVPAAVGGQGDGAAQAAYTLAVLPLTNAGHGPGLDFLSEGIAEMVINRLAQQRRLRVLARCKVFSYKVSAMDPQEIGQELNVQAILTGRILQLESNLIISAELVNVADGSQIWGEQFSRPVSDVLTLQEEMASALAERLCSRLLADE